MVTSTMGMLPAQTASAANMASSAECRRTAGMIPISSIRARTSSLVIRSFCYESKQVPGSNRLAKLLQRRQISRHRLAVGELSGAIGALGVQEIEQGQGAAPVRVLADIAALLRHIQIARSKELRDLRALLQPLVRISHVRQNLPAGRLLLLLRLPDRNPRLRNITLVSVENRQRNTERPGGRTDAVDVRVIARDGGILLSIRLRERILAVGGGNPQRRRAQVRTVLQGLGLQFLETDRQRPVFEFARDVVVGGHRVVTQLLPEVRQRLGLVQQRLLNVAFKLKELELDLQVVVLALRAVLELHFADVHRFLETFQILLCEFEGRLRKLRIDEERANLKRNASLVIGHLRARHGGGAFGR